MTTNSPNLPQKPLLRGYLHQEAFFTTLGAAILLIAKSSTSLSLISSIVFSIGLLLLFGISALYHRPYWKPKARVFLKRLDHSAIFILIASTFTPICLLALPPASGNMLLIIVWIAAVLGILQSIFWVKAPKIVTALLYIIMGWQALPYLKELNQSLGTSQLSLLITGGIIYTIGAIFYAAKTPKLYPTVFGYHELFHFFTIIAAACHFAVIYHLIN